MKTMCDLMLCKFTILCKCCHAFKAWQTKKRKQHPFLWSVPTFVLNDGNREITITLWRSFSKTTLLTSLQTSSTKSRVGYSVLLRRSKCIAFHSQQHLILRYCDIMWCSSRNRHCKGSRRMGLSTARPRNGQRRISTKTMHTRPCHVR